MHYSLALSFLAISGTRALPHYAARAADTSITVSLSNGKTLNTDSKFGEQLPQTISVADGPFTTVNLTLGADVDLQDLRCQIVDVDKKPIVVLRGGNVDITFADGGAGAWTLREPSKVSSITCDPKFKKISPDDDRLNLKVILSNILTETTSQTDFKAGVLEKTSPNGSVGPYKTVELKVGEFVAVQTQRCQVLDKAGKPVTVKRNGVTDITFADGGAGEWTFNADTKIEKIICDPKFVADPQ
ncbi:hypothetical protein LTR84_000709 [Exophiala bonariae]|uniref:Ubiquitin 3 binding protein But2 C-terminal domain-containing protein n=1 Tax=Exophiala bonariae TaxID=1690606 RepID=A0AAV9NVC5_9EURO|nr:hypothetical protein LTR84_000709 [Exophiala bonariae]